MVPTAMRSGPASAAGRGWVQPRFQVAREWHAAHRSPWPLESISRNHASQLTTTQGSERRFLIYYTWPQLQFVDNLDTHTHLAHLACTTITSRPSGSL
jgi:hypothetical protein